VAVPITTLSTVTSLPQNDLGAMVGRQTPILGVFVPIALVLIIDGLRGVRETFPALLVCGLSFTVMQFATSNYISVPLTDIVAALVSAGATVLFLRVWRATPYTEAREPELVGAGVGGGSRAVGAEHALGTARTTGASRGGSTAGVGGGRMAGATATAEPTRTGAVGTGNGAAATDGAGIGRGGVGPDDGVGRGPDGGAGHDIPRDEDVHDPPIEVFRAYAPYLIIILVFVLAQVGPIKDALTSVTTSYHWPGLTVVSASGKPSTLTTFKFDWLDASGTLLLIAGLLTMPVLKLSPARALKAYGATLKQLWTAIITVMAVLALAYVMNLSGQTVTLGTWMAGAGGAFAVVSPLLGWLGTAVTGSDTSSNSLFGALQVTAANKAGLSATLMAASNSSGGVLGKMISPQNLAIAAAAVGMAGKEGDLFRKVILWSLVFIALMCLLVYLQSTPVLSWMVVGGG
jgi:lactate permease